MTNNSFEYRYYNFGPFLMMTCIDHTLYQDICADLRDNVWPSKIDYRSQLAGKIDNEYYFGEVLQNKYEQLLKPYMVEYVSCLLSTWLETSEEEMSDTNSKAGLLLSHLHNLKLVDIWANFQKRREYNPIHNHGGDISFVLYIDVPEEIYNEEQNDTSYSNGTIHFIDGYDSRIDMRELSETSVLIKNALLPRRQTEGFKPTNGDLFIFPSYLSHAVEHFKSDVTRITVSGNWLLP